MTVSTFDAAHDLATEALNGKDAGYCFLIGAEFLAHVERPDVVLDEAEAHGIVQLGILLIEAAASSGELAARNCLLLFRDELEYLRVGGVGPAPLTLASC